MYTVKYLKSFSQFLQVKRKSDEPGRNLNVFTIFLLMFSFEFIQELK